MIRLDSSLTKIFDITDGSVHCEQVSSSLTEHIQILSSSNLEDLKDEAQRVRDLFFKTLPQYDYDRSAIALRSPLEAILDPSIALAHDGLDRIDPVTSRRIHETIAETHFSLHLGVKPEKAESAYHSVFYLLNRSNERLGVFKPRDTKQSALEDLYGSAENREAHLSEVTSSKIDQMLGSGLIPHTELFTCDLPCVASPQMTGSYQFYVKDAPFLYDVLEGDDLWEHSTLKANLDVPANRELDLQNFEEMAFLDLLIGDNDHHFKNILLQNGKLVLIDNGNSLPWCHDRDLPSYKMHPLHWFKWRALPQANTVFSSQMVDKINHLDVDSIEELMREHLVHPTAPSSIEHIDGKVITLRERIAETRRLAVQQVKIADIAQSLINLSHLH